MRGDYVDSSAYMSVRLPDCPLHTAVLLDIEDEVAHKPLPEYSAGAAQADVGPVFNPICALQLPCWQHLAGVQYVGRNGNGWVQRLACVMHN